jgi:hypothetical protein
VASEDEREAAGGADSPSSSAKNLDMSTTRLDDSIVIPFALEELLYGNLGDGFPLYHI